MAENPEFQFRLNSGSTVNSLPSQTGTKDTSSSEGRWHADTHPWQKTPDSPPPALDHDTSSVESSGESDISVCEAIHDRLRANSVRRPSSKEELGFWPAKLFDSLITKKDVEFLLRELAETDGVKPDIDDDAEIISKSYRKILALLMLVEEESLVRDFVLKGIDDTKIPFALDYDFKGLIKQRKLKRSHGDTIRNDYQWRLNVPFFRRADPGHVYHLDISERDYQPWDRLDVRPREKPRADPALLSVRTTGQTTLPASVTLAGGYGEVHKIIIHPWQHDYHEVLERWTSEKNVFALKHLLTDNETKFYQEIDQLKRFGGQHEHIVTLLSTISLTSGNHKDFYLLFPWADSDLLGYWERHSRPILSEGMWRWLIEQCYGIVDAVAFIHNPGNKMQSLEGKRLYGRHGDIKPENVLWFIKRQSEGGRGALVLSDLGLAAVHRDTSRSNIPGEAIPRTPNYRPPECDMDGPKGHISRSFDIWTMGCLFLEFIVWALEGWDGRVEFRFSRCGSAYLNGETDVFFDIKRTEKESAKSDYVFQVKDAVTERIISLYNNPACPRIIQRLLRLIRDEMLIVQSQDPPINRIRAGDLCKKVGEFKRLCAQKDGDWLKPSNREPPMRVGEVHAPVKAPLNDEAKRNLGIDDRFDKLKVFSGGEVRTTSGRRAPGAS